MPKSPSFFFVLQQEFFIFKNILIIFFIACLYTFFLAVLLNYRLVLASSTSSQFIQIILSLWVGIFTSLSALDSILFILTALLVGINIFLIFRTLSILHSQKLRLSVGSASIVDIVSTGCGSCGLSLLSVLGLGTTFSFLPYHGFEVHLLALGFLVFSSGYMLKKLHLALYCKRM